jgi:hypothetical protein
MLANAAYRDVVIQSNSIAVDLGEKCAADTGRTTSKPMATFDDVPSDLYELEKRRLLSIIKYQRMPMAVPAYKPRSSRQSIYIQAYATYQSYKNKRRILERSVVHARMMYHYDLA